MLSLPFNFIIEEMKHEELGLQQTPVEKDIKLYVVKEQCRLKIRANAKAVKSLLNDRVHDLQGPS